MTVRINAWPMRIEPLGRTVIVSAGETLLQAALRAGVILPSSCRNGTCRACLCRLTEGHIAYTIPWPGVSPDEKAAGEILACVATPLTPVVIEQAGARDATDVFR